MEKVKKWMEKNRQLCVMTGIFGMLLAPFLWPFFLAIIFNSLTLAVPVLLGYLLFHQMQKEKKDEKQEGNVAGENVQEQFCNSEKNESSVHKTNIQTKPLQSGRPEERKKAVKETDEKIPDEDNKRQTVLTWYQMEGRERILRLKNKLEQEKINAFSISREGVCTVREEKRFRRIGVIKSFPQNEIVRIKQELRKDGIKIKIKGRYVWLSWEEVHH